MSTTNISFNLNGKDVTIDVECSATLLQVLREQLKITSLKSSCVMGECGACTIIIDGKAMNSCLVLAPTIDGKHVETVESLGDTNHMHPIQRAFKETAAFQCGFCTPGFIMSTKALLDKKPAPTREEIKEALSGNLCRCTGYKKPLDGVEKAAEIIREEKKIAAVKQAAKYMKNEVNDHV